VKRKTVNKPIKNSGNGKHVVVNPRQGVLEVVTPASTLLPAIRRAPGTPQERADSFLAWANDVSRIVEKPSPGVDPFDRDIIYEGR
jgi:hypothetical protein